MAATARSWDPTGRRSATPALASGSPPTAASSQPASSSRRKVATLSNAHWTQTPCGALTYGYQLNLGANVALASKPGGPCVNGAVAGATIGPFSTATLLRIFLTDTGTSNQCNYTFYSDGSHALVTGTGPWIVDISDSFFCARPPNVASVPTGVGKGNIDVTVTVT